MACISFTNLEKIYNLTYKFTKHQTFEISLTRDILLKKLWAKKKEIKTKKELPGNINKDCNNMIYANNLIIQ